MALGLGGNLGDPVAWFRIAAKTFAPHLTSLAAAPLYRSEAVSPIRQPPYLNTVLAGLTATAPEDLLAIAKALELAAGRRAGPRDSPRPLDVDLLLYGDLVRDTLELRLPHPRLRLRSFALAPLADLAPDAPLPPDGRTVAAILAEMDGAQRVVRIGRWLEG